jgi:microcystin-dependent protein
MAEPYLGQIQSFGFNFAPRGWAKCDGQLLPSSQNSALFALLGTMYGGDGRTTFGLPDLRGRAAIHHGQGPGLPERKIGEKSKPKKVVSGDEDGDGQSQADAPPFLVLNWCIAMAGIFPSRS